MKRFRIVPTLLLLALLSLKGKAAEFDRESYRPSTLADVHKYECVEATENVRIDARRLKVRAKVRFAQRTRTISAGAAEFLRMWAKVFGIADSFRDLFTHEIGVREGVLDYWLPIQGPLLPQLLEEAPSEREVILYAIYGGCLGTAHVFLVTEFEVPEPTP